MVNSALSIYLDSGKKIKNKVSTLSLPLSWGRPLFFTLNLKGNVFVEYLISVLHWAG
jgi:hypothetical protein